MEIFKKRQGTKKLGIRFGDNDFYYMCTAFLRVLLPDESYTHRSGQNLTFTKAQVVELFNGMAPSLYLLKQNCWEYDAGLLLPSYLTITEKDVYLDDEVDKFAVDHNNDHNGEFFAVNFTTSVIWAV